MANPNKAKGTRHETEIVNYLNSEGLNVYRPAPGGPRDTGDIHGLPLFAIQAKNWKNIADAETTLPYPAAGDSIDYADALPREGDFHHHPKEE